MTLTSPDAGGRRVLAVLQPGYLPWLGFFDQMRRADVFVYYDDVQYDKHGWRNRNRLKSPQGPHWLTVPVRHAGLGKPCILDVEIDPTAKWARKHVGTIRQFYREAPYFDRYILDVEALLLHPWRRLVDLDIAVAAKMAEWLGVTTPVLRASELGVGGDRNQRLVNLCLHVGATGYLSGNAAQTYLDRALFAAHGIEVIWQDYEHPAYPQLHGAFEPFLSALDLLLNCGEESARVLGGALTRGHA